MGWKHRKSLTIYFGTFKNYGGERIWIEDTCNKQRVDKKTMIMLFLLCVYIMGFVAAIPIGATQLEIARRSMNGYLSSALMVMVGSVLSDVMYGAIAFFGITSFLQEPGVVAIFWMVGASLLVVLGVWVIRESKRSVNSNSPSGKILRHHKTAFLTGFSLAVTNPFMIMWWLLGARLMNDIGIIQRYNTFDFLLFLMSGGLGIASYLSLLALVIYRVKKFFSERNIRRITMAFGIVLLGLAAYFILQSALGLMK
jgi:threonine/homoserine/homoserine lactone efflux protein